MSFISLWSERGGERMGKHREMSADILGIDILRIPVARSGVTPDHREEGTLDCRTIRVVLVGLEGRELGERHLGIG